MYAMLLCARLVLLGQFIWPGVSSAAGGAAPADPAPQAATTSAVSNVDSSATDLDNLTLVQLFRGQKRLTPADLTRRAFWGSLVRDPLQIIVALGPRALIALVLLLMAWALNRGVRKVLRASLTRAAVDDSIHDMLSVFLKWTILGGGVVLACNQLGIQLGGLIAGVSIAGLAIGLAAQETLANFIAGLVICCDRPFRAGDIVNIDGAVGTIQRVTFRSTRLLTFDGEIVVLPNTAVLAHKLTNHSAHNTGRINITVGISYSASVDAARTALLAMVADDERIRKDPEPAVVVSELADSSVRLNFWFWSVDKCSVARLKFEYMEKVKEALDAAGIEIPFPHLNILIQPRVRQAAERELQLAS